MVVSLCGVLFCFSKILKGLFGQQPESRIGWLADHPEIGIRLALFFVTIFLFGRFNWKKEYLIGP